MYYLNILFMRKRRCFTLFVSLILVLFMFSTLVLLITRKIKREFVIKEIPAYGWKFLSYQYNETEYSGNISDLQNIFESINDQNIVVNNVDKFGKLGNDTVVLVIKVHKITENLKYLLASLSEVSAMEQALIIFSHTYFDENVNKFIKMIDFCRYIQIYYPFSIQAYPNSFPGFDPNDCKHDMPVDEGEKLKCNGYKSPDIRGKFRNPKWSQMKLHWWWTANKVFDGMTEVGDFIKFVLFIEEDTYVTEDFLHIAVLLSQACSSLRKCDFLSLGTNTLLNPNENRTNVCEVSTWWPSLHSQFVGFKPDVWRSIVSHYDLFCYYDDYSWSNSLFYLSITRENIKRFKVISSVVPRAARTSFCGSLNPNFLCDITVDNIYDILRINKKNKNIFFPKSLQVYLNIEVETESDIIIELTDMNGGWSDPRDIQLCNNMTLSKIYKILLDMDRELME